MTRLNSLKPLRVVVIGGGAAGFFGAIACAQARPGTRITLLEAGPQPLAKVRISGGGRCNVTHACFEPAVLTQQYPRGSKALRGPFTRFGPQDTLIWFKGHGVRLKTEPDGRMFPVTDDSATVVDCLMRTAHASGVQVRTGATVVAVERTERGFETRLKSGEALLSDCLLLATGSSSTGYRLAKSLGHQVEPPVPSLFTFNVLERQLRDLAGVATPARLRLAVEGSTPLEQTGPLLITHWGLSGPAALKLSAWGARVLHTSRYRASLQINWLPEQDLEGLREQLLVLKAEWARRAIHSSGLADLPRRLWHYLVNRAGIAPDERWAALSKPALNRLLQELTQGSYAIEGKGPFKEEFVTCGGVNLKEVDFKTMASRRCRGLYLAGEVLDVDGVTGGFNFQNAWTTAWLAGQAMAAWMSEAS